MKRFGLVFTTLLCLSCSARIEGALDASGALEIPRVRAALGARTAGLLQSLVSNFASPGAPAAQETVLLDGAAISRSLEAAPGVTAAELRNTGPAALEGRITIARIGGFLLRPDGEKALPFVTYTAQGGEGRLTVALDRKSAPQILPLLSPEIAAYLEALMAPAVTGEALSRREYLDLVRSIYGASVAEEIAAARLTVSLTLPAPGKAIKGGIFSQPGVAQFEVPLPDLLVLDRPFQYEVTW